GRQYLVERRGVPAALVPALSSLGSSSICNVLAAVKTARYYDMGRDDMVVTVATDSAAMYGSEREKALRKHFPNGFDDIAAGEAISRHMLGANVEHLIQLSEVDRKRIFNLGYFTWVEQQDVSVEDFRARENQSFWRQIREIVPVWDQLIEEFNGRVGAVDA